MEKENMVMKKELIKNEKKRINKLVELAYKQYTLF
jgi:hypothetical protein